MWDLVENPENWFYHNEAQTMLLPQMGPQSALCPHDVYESKVVISFLLTTKQELLQ